MFRFRQLILPIALLLLFSVFLSWRIELYLHAPPMLRNDTITPAQIYPARWESVAHVSGIVVSIHGGNSSLANLMDQHVSGDLVRYDIADGKTIRGTLIYAGGDATFACISPRGNRVAFVKTDGAIGLMDVNGGPVTTLTHIDSDMAYIQWPGAEDGQWIYYVGSFTGPPSKILRRVNVITRKVELIQRFNREISSFGLSSETTPAHGKLAARVFAGR